jgi:hypothetical protein
MIDSELNSSMKRLELVIAMGCGGNVDFGAGGTG